MKRNLLGNRKTAMLAILASLAIGIAAAGSASAGPCKLQRHTGVSDLFVKKSYALRHAKGRWAIAARERHGPHFMHWKWAQSKSLRARKIRGSWLAIANGRPCMGPSSLTLKQ